LGECEEWRTVGKHLDGIGKDDYNAWFAVYEHLTDEEIGIEKENTMKFTVTCSTADGDQTKDFNNWNDAHLYANEWMNGFTHCNHRHFNNIESDEYINLWQTRKGECVHIKEKTKENTMALILKDEFQEMLRIIRESSVANIGFTDSLTKALNGHSLKDLSDEGQRELIQTWLYSTNDDDDDDVFDEETDKKVEQWYRDRATTFTFHSFAPYCSMCFRDNPSYVGITEQGTPFEFCRQCRDELKRKKDELMTPPERFGV